MLSVFVAAWLPGPPPLSAQEAGARSFDRALVLEDSAATSANVSIGDVNGDKRLDLVLVKGRHWPLEDRVLLGDGVGGFADAYSVSPTADRSYSGVLVDMDGDGDLDIVVSNDEPDPKVVHLNDGSGRFTVGSTFGEPEWSTRHVTVADLDRDGHVDAVLANRYGPSSGPSFACFGDGVGGFARPCRIVSEGSATTITTADVNGDDWPDLVVPHRDGGQSWIYLNDGRGGFGDRVPFGPPDAAIRSVRTADLDGDGDLDLAAIDERGGPVTFRQTSPLVFAPAEPLGQSAARPYAIQVADLDQDGRTDVIVGYVEARPIAFFNEGGEAYTPVAFGDDQGAAYGFAVADMNGDGLVDIAMARSGATNVLYFGNVEGGGREP